MPRARKDPRTGKFVTAERTTTTVTERLTVEDAGPVTHPPPPVAGRPLRVYGFTSLLTSPPEDARWAHPEFVATEAARAATADAAPPEPFVPAPVTLTDDEVQALRERFLNAVRTQRPEVLSHEPPVPYPPLAEATLEHEFTLTGPLDMIP